jgi:diaminopimelate decarboxylase
LEGVAKQARQLGMEPVIANFGGGYPSSNRLKPAFDVQGGSSPKGHVLAPFAEALVGRLLKARKAFGGKPTLMLEPGRAIVDVAVRLACTVVARKEISGQCDAVVVDAGVNLVPTAYWYDHGIDAIADREDDQALVAKPIAVFGPLCMQIDVLRDRALLPPMSVGSPLVISNVGAYCLTQSMQFIQPRPAVVLASPNGIEVIRRREGWRDIFGLDQVPARLKAKGSRF